MIQLSVVAVTLKGLEILGVLWDITGFMGHSIGPLETTELSDRIKDRSAPDWASGM